MRRQIENLSSSNPRRVARTLGAVVTMRQPAVDRNELFRGLKPKLPSLLDRWDQNNGCKVEQLALAAQTSWQARATS